MQEQEIQISLPSPKIRHLHFGKTGYQSIKQLFYGEQPLRV